MNKTQQSFSENTTYNIIDNEHVIACINKSWTVTDKTKQGAIDLDVSWFAVARLRGEYDE